jgi:hypothetical protein
MMAIMTHRGAGVEDRARRAQNRARSAHVDDALEDFEARVAVEVGSRSLSDRGRARVLVGGLAHEADREFVVGPGCAREWWWASMSRLKRSEQPPAVLRKPPHGEPYGQ